MVQHNFDMKRNADAPDRIRYFSPMFARWIFALVMGGTGTALLWIPDWEAILVSFILFLLPALWVIVTNLLYLRKRARLRQYPPELRWRSDHPWPGNRIEDDTQEMLRFLIQRSFVFGSLASLCFSALIGLLVLVLTHGKEPTESVLIVAIPMFLFAISLIPFFRTLRGLARKLERKRRFGVLSLRLSEPPIRLGSRFKAMLESPSLAGRSDLRVTLRCLAEQYVFSGNSRVFRRILNCPLALSGNIRIDPSGFAEISFDLPAGLPETDLSRHPPLYWELTLTLSEKDAGRSDTEWFFLLPVYRAG